MKSPRRTLLIILKTAVTCAILAFVILRYGVSLEELTASKIEEPFWVCVALFVVLIINPALASTRWKVFLHYVGIERGRMELIKIFFISGFYGVVLPSVVGMDVVKIHLIERTVQAKKGPAGSTIVAQRILGFLLLSIIGLLGSVFLKKQLASDTSSLSIVMLCISLTVLLLVLTVTNRGLFKLFNIISGQLAKGIGIGIVIKAISYVSRLHESLVELPLGKCLPRALPFMIMFQLSSILVGYLIFLSFGVELPFSTHVALLPIIQIITIIPISISGFGLREGAFVFFYTQMGVPSEIAIGVSVLYFVATSGAAAVVGGGWALLSRGEQYMNHKAE